MPALTDNATFINGYSQPGPSPITGYGIWIQGSPCYGSPDGTIIGGEDSTLANVISANPQDGIYSWRPNGGGSKILRNRIGVDIHGEPLGNIGSGIHLDKRVTADSILYNWIAYNQQDGVLVNDTNSNEHVIIANKINNNDRDGVRLFGLVQNCEIVDCEIANNTRNGIYVAGPGSDGKRLSQNSIYGNDSLGIELAPKGVTPNDEDEGPNENMNFPVLDSASTTRIYGRLQGLYRETAVIEAFIAGVDRTEVEAPTTVKVEPISARERQVAMGDLPSSQNVRKSETTLPPSW